MKEAASGLSRFKLSELQQAILRERASCVEAAEQHWRSVNNRRLMGGNVEADDWAAAPAIQARGPATNIDYQLNATAGMLQQAVRELERAGVAREVCDNAQALLRQDYEHCLTLDESGDLSFHNGAKAMFTYLQIALANHYHFEPEENAQRQREVDVLSGFIEDALASVSPRTMSEFLAVKKALDEGFKDGYAAATKRASTPTEAHPRVEPAPKHSELTLPLMVTAAGTLVLGVALIAAQELGGLQVHPVLIPCLALLGASIAAVSLAVNLSYTRKLHRWSKRVSAQNSSQGE